MIAYQDFAVALSALVVLQYLGLFGIALRRAQFGRPRLEPVAVRVRAFEGPLITVLLAIALGTAFASVLIGTPTYQVFAAYFIAAIRGGLFVLGLWLLAYYWSVRGTWV